MCLNTIVDNQSENVMLQIKTVFYWFQYESLIIAMRRVIVSLYNTKNQKDQITTKKERTNPKWLKSTFRRPNTLIITPPSNMGCESTADTCRAIFWKPKLWKQKSIINIKNALRFYKVPTFQLKVENITSTNSNDEKNHRPSECHHV